MTNLTTRIAAGISAAFLGIAAAQAETGVTDTTIRVGILGSLTGPAAIWGTGNLAGATLAVEQANAAGGIHGRMIELVSMDDETSAPRGMAAFSRLVESEEVFAIVGPTSSAVGVPLLGEMAASDVPVFISIFSSPLMTDPPVRNIFRAGVINDRIQGRAIAQYLVEGGAERIAILRQSDEYGAMGGNSVQEKLTELGREPAAVELFNAADTDFSAQILRIRAANPDAIVIYGYPAAGAILTRQIREMGLTARIIGSSASANTNFPQTVGPAAAGVEIVSLMTVLPEQEIEPMVTFRREFRERFPDLARQDRPTISDIMGYGGALVFLEGLRRAGPDLTRDGFIAALETIENFDTGMNLPSTFGPDRREGTSTIYVLTIQDDLSRTINPDPIEAD